MCTVLTNYGLGLIVNTNGSRRIKKPLFVSKTITGTTRRRQEVEGVEKERLPVRGSSKSLENLSKHFFGIHKTYTNTQTKMPTNCLLVVESIALGVLGFLSYVFNMCIVALANNRQVSFKVPIFVGTK